MPAKASKRKSQPSSDMTRMMSSLPPAIQQQLMDLTTTMHNVHRDCEHQTVAAETAARDIQILRRDLEDAVEQRVAAEGAATNAKATVARLEQELATARTLRADKEKAERAVRNALQIFNDQVTLVPMKCPIPVSNGRLLDMESVIESFMRGSATQRIFFDGTLNSKFEDGVSGEAVTVMGAEVIRLVHDIAKTLGLKIEMPYWFEYTEEPREQEGYITWKKYEIDDQLRILLQLLLMHRERETVQIDALATKTVTVAKKHHITFTRTSKEVVIHHRNPAIANDVDITETQHTINYTLCVINAGGRGAQHDIHYSYRVPLDLDGFTLAGDDDDPYDL